MTERALEPIASNAREETIEQALERRRALPLEEREGVKAPEHIKKDFRQLVKWSVICLFQDRPVFVVLAAAILIFEIIKTLADAVLSLVR